MPDETIPPVRRALDNLFTSHPWHGVSLGPKAPDIVTCYIEIVPTDAVKYEVDKASGLLRVDRPQRYSNVSPSPYGFLPRTYCGVRVGALCSDRTGRPGVIGDGDPLDVCVLTEKPLAHGNLLVEAIPIGGLRMLDGAEADDKIIAVLDGDAVYGGLKDVSECPQNVVDRLRHYFLTYKQAPGGGARSCEITDVYDRAEAHEVIRRSLEDYASSFGDAEGILTSALR